MRPAYITASRWATVDSTERSWVMKTMASPRSVWIRSSRASTWAWTITSSAVVGSSAIRRRGSQARAMAIITRCFWPPESSCG